MARIPFATIEDADTRSEALWTNILGRTKRAEDVTRFLYSRTVDEATGVVAIDVPLRDAYLDRLLRAGRIAATEVVVLSALYPAWQTATRYAKDTLVAYLGQIYKVVESHTSSLDNPPDLSPTLYANVVSTGVT